jgi:hypothetical protein
VINGEMLVRTLTAFKRGDPRVSRPVFFGSVKQLTHGWLGKVTSSLPTTPMLHPLAEGGALWSSSIIAACDRGGLNPLSFERTKKSHMGTRSETARCQIPFSSSVQAKMACQVPRLSRPTERTPISAIS